MLNVLKTAKIYSRDLSVLNVLQFADGLKLYMQNTDIA